MDWEIRWLYNAFLENNTQVRISKSEKFQLKDKYCFSWDEPFNTDLGQIFSEYEILNREE